ncbi:UNKNOWN [Stylonychia lemnae]|uniref:Cyclic nucleotide-binding domain-containing protein n=1 Tax=Stylonychia lemnae TaxID=5949 RepID=A0A078AD99_STYLE|nr:UNKNOWN [Stylonychia lemnae]|eukprot:CDW79507.1 UNKNOWN [Stylonychia lemnae]
MNEDEIQPLKKEKKLQNFNVLFTPQLKPSKYLESFIIEKGGPRKLTVQLDRVDNSSKSSTKKVPDQAKGGSNDKQSIISYDKESTTRSIKEQGLSRHNQQQQPFQLYSPQPQRMLNFKNGLKQMNVPGLENNLLSPQTSQHKQEENMDRRRMMLQKQRPGRLDMKSIGRGGKATVMNVLNQPNSPMLLRQLSPKSAGFAPIPMSPMSVESRAKHQKVVKKLIQEDDVKKQKSRKEKYRKKNTILKNAGGFIQRNTKNKNSMIGNNKENHETTENRDEEDVELEIFKQFMEANQREPSWGVTSPDSLFKTLWDIFMFVWIIWQAIFIPYRLCFDIQISEDDAISSLEYFIDICFGVDMILSLNTDLFFAHTMACLFWMVGSNGLSSNYISWITKIGLNDADVMTQYVNSLYWSITTMVSVGYGDISALNVQERLFSMFAMIVANGVYAFTISNVGKIVSQYNEAAVHFRENMFYVGKWMKQHDLGNELRVQIRRYLEFQWDLREQMKIEEEDVMNLLNEDLREKLILYTNAKSLRNLSFCNQFKLEFITDLAFQMKSQTFGVGENVIMVDIFIFIDFQENEEGDKIFFITRGKVCVLHRKTHTYLDDLTVIDIIQKYQIDDYFGEISFFTEQPRTTNVKSLKVKLSNNSLRSPVGKQYLSTQEQMEMRDVELLVDREENKDKSLVNTMQTLKQKSLLGDDLMKEFYKDAGYNYQPYQNSFVTELNSEELVDDSSENYKSRSNTQNSHQRRSQMKMPYKVVELDTNKSIKKSILGKASLRLQKNKQYYESSSDEESVQSKKSARSRNTKENLSATIRNQKSTDKIVQQKSQVVKEVIDNFDDNRIYFHPESSNIKPFEKDFNESYPDVETILEAEEYEEETPYNKQIVSIRNNLRRQLQAKKYDDTTDSMRADSIISQSDSMSMQNQSSHQINNGNNNSSLSVGSGHKNLSSKFLQFAKLDLGKKIFKTSTVRLDIIDEIPKNIGQQSTNSHLNKSIIEELEFDDSNKNDQIQADKFGYIQSFRGEKILTYNPIEEEDNSVSDVNTYKDNVTARTTGEQILSKEVTDSQSLNNKNSIERLEYFNNLEQIVMQEIKEGFMDDQEDYSQYYLEEGEMSELEVEDLDATNKQADHLQENGHDFSFNEFQFQGDDPSIDTVQENIIVREFERLEMGLNYGDDSSNTQNENNWDSSNNNSSIQHQQNQDDSGYSSLNPRSDSEQKDSLDQSNNQDSSINQLQDDR